MLNTKVKIQSYNLIRSKSLDTGFEVKIREPKNKHTSYINH